MEPHGEPGRAPCTAGRRAAGAAQHGPPGGGCAHLSLRPALIWVGLRRDRGSSWLSRPSVGSAWPGGPGVSREAASRCGDAEPGRGCCVVAASRGRRSGSAGLPKERGGRAGAEKRDGNLRGVSGWLAAPRLRASRYIYIYVGAGRAGSVGLTATPEVRTEPQDACAVPKHAAAFPGRGRRRPQLSGVCAGAAALP